MSSPRLTMVLVMLLMFSSKSARSFDARTMLKAVPMMDTTFSKFVAADGGGGGRDGEGWFVLFYMPWCGFCKEVLPVWDRLAEELKGECSVGKVNLEDEKGIQYRFRHKVKGYPAMYFIRNNTVAAYTGTRDINHLKEFARGGYRLVDKDASGPVPPDPTTFNMFQTILAHTEDFILDVASGYRGVWRDYRNEFLAGISTFFSLGGIFGFGVKIFIDTVLFPPLQPPRSSASLGSKPKAA